MAAPQRGGGGGLSTTIPRQYRKLATAAAAESGLPLNVVAAQIDEESGWQPDVTSPTGAQGIAQFEPGTWATWGHGSPFVPANAFPAYGRFMGSLLREFHGNIRDALAAYNAGPGNLQAGYGYADTILGAAGLPGSAHSQHIPYRNPLRDVRGLSASRVDMGVDYGGTGPVYALGPGVITGVNQSWAGGVGDVGPGTYIAERLTGGPLAGRQIYVAENITPTVRPGQKVTASTQIGQMTGPIETGFAAAGQPGTLGETAAAAAGQQDPGHDPGGRPSAFGAAYSKILHALGAPAGSVSGQPAGSTPPWLAGILTELRLNPVTGGPVGAAGDAAGIAGAIGSIGQDEIGRAHV